MPGTQSAQRARSLKTVQPPSVETAPTRQPPPPSAGQVRDDASSAIHQLQGSAAVRGNRGIGMHQAVDALAAAYDEGGIHAVNGALRESPALVAALGGRSREAVEAALDSDERLSAFESSSVMGAIQTEVTATLRRGIAAGARDRLGQQMQRIGRERNALAGELEKLGAPPSDPARAADLEEGIALLDQVRDNITELQTRFQGQAWEVGDFERTARRASMRMGMGAGTHDSFALEALGERSGEAEAHAHHAAVAGELAMELPHVAHAGLLSLPMGLLVGGLAVGHFIHKAAEEHRHEFLEAAHTLGVR